MSEKCNCKNSSCHSKKNSKSNLTASVEEGCDRDKVPNPKTATNNQW